MIEISDIMEWAANYSGPQFHALLCDPPYELGFMNKKWDGTGIAFNPQTWAALGKHLKPGAHLLIFGGSRTFHRIACAVEDAGFEIRDTLMYLYGSGFPKSLDVSKAIDKEANIKRVILEERPATSAAKQWSGWGTALKPAFEPIILARKPLSEKTVASNVLKHGTGAINVDACRVGVRTENESGWSKTGSEESVNRAMSGKNYTRLPKNEIGLGRWPANVIHDGSDEVLAEFAKYGESKSVLSKCGLQHSGRHGGYGDLGGNPKEGTNTERGHNDSGTAARFFYTAKASRAERDAGIITRANLENEYEGVGALRDSGRALIKRNNTHPTVKPIELIKYLATLLLPSIAAAPRKILIPFAGSGSEIIGALHAGWEEVLGIEKEKEYAELFLERLRAWKEVQLKLE